VILPDNRTAIELLQVVVSPITSDGCACTTSLSNELDTAAGALLALLDVLNVQICRHGEHRDLAIELVTDLASRYGIDLERWPIEREPVSLATPSTTIKLAAEFACSHHTVMNAMPGDILDYEIIRSERLQGTCAYSLPAKAAAATRINLRKILQMEVVGP
jgi:hypothetical protein